MENSILRTLKNFSLMERQIPICRKANNTFYVMLHPASRKSTVKLLEELFKSQTIAMQSNYLAKK